MKCLFQHDKSLQYLKVKTIIITNTIKQKDTYSLVLLALYVDIFWRNKEKKIWFQDGARIDITPEKRCNICKRPQEIKIVNFDTDLETDSGGNVSHQLSVASCQPSVGSLFFLA